MVHQIILIVLVYLVYLAPLVCDGWRPLKESAITSNGTGTKLTGEQIDKLALGPTRFGNRDIIQSESTN
jgi:hypothetical protein